ncbi:MAG: hypothetical protein OEZ65_09775 [Gemmatimonadota bacterium]|nr:hypothetical protein [Gemmatimonadota bacterium]MDH5759865.1 hypothetical protein [Gemmatimonadota bacterium]
MIAEPDRREGDGTLDGYIALHQRPPAFEGSDGHAYTVSAEVERTGNLRAPWSGFLVFPRWAADGMGIVGHRETPTLVEARSEEDARSHLGALALPELKALLETAITDDDEPRGR